MFAELITDLNQESFFDVFKDTLFQNSSHLNRRGADPEFATVVNFYPPQVEAFVSLP